MIRGVKARLTFGLLVVVIGLSACDSGSSSSTSSTRVTTIVPAISVPTTTTRSSTTAAPATSSVATSAVSTTNPTTSAPATTSTVDPTEATKAAVVAAVAQSRLDYQYAIFNYDAPDALDVLGRSWSQDSPAWNLSVGNMSTLRSNGWLARPQPGVPDSSTAEGDVQLLDEPPDSKALVTVCTIDSGLVYKPGAGPDGADVVINDAVTASRELVTMVLRDGSWKAESGKSLGTWKGETSCPAA